MKSETTQGNIWYSFPVEQTYTKEYLQANFWKCLYTTGDENLHYWAILPNSVKPNKLEPVRINELSITNIGQYVRDDNSPYLEVQVAYEHYEFEMNASDWIKKKLVMMGEEIIAERVIKGKSTGNYLDVLCKKNISGTNIISRFTVLKDYNNRKGGANYFCIKATCEEEHYEDLSLSMLQIVTNWDLINKSDWQMAELLTPFMDEFTEPVKFFVPQSWEAKYNKNTNHSFSNYIFEHSMDGKNRGVINSFFYKTEEFGSVELLVNSQLARFEIIDDLQALLTPIERVESKEIQNPAVDILYNIVGTLDSENENFHASITVAIIKTLKGWYYFESIGPKPNLQNNYWEVNRRCIQIMINSFNNLTFEVRDESHFNS
ncbi:hypothetical protein LF887_05055 [Chryseobacterium sp. MEBOG06]|uniref:hypothetical protein n=1 Tax=unclassified Chryseobacterium TaxID=2593645 RepID=UPI001F469ECB|nr:MULTISPECIES: hypothetical protein [unclassified Chryseobacterium]UKB85003.1 hypothetical protein LF887_05055 [Chryseobacterium sp. MEBOG06]